MQNRITLYKGACALQLKRLRNLDVNVRLEFLSSEYVLLGLRNLDVNVRLEFLSSEYVLLYLLLVVAS